MKEIFVSVPIFMAYMKFLSNSLTNLSAPCLPAMAENENLSALTGMIQSSAFTLGKHKFISICVTYLWVLV